MLICMNVHASEFPNIFKNYPQYTVYGLSPDPSKTSHRISMNMKEFGFQLYGVYPKDVTIANIPIVQTLQNVPKEYRKMVNVFRRSEKIIDVVEEAIEAGGVELLWFQLGITNEKAETKAQNHGIKVISDRCIYVEYMKSK